MIIVALHRAGHRMTVRRPEMGEKNDSYNRIVVRPGGEWWINGLVSIFKRVKAYLRMEIIEFQADNVRKNVYNRSVLKNGP